MGDHETPGGPLPPPDPLLGATIDGIRLVRKLGAGGFASVYEGRREAVRSGDAASGDAVSSGEGAPPVEGGRPAAAEPAIVAVKVMHPHMASPGLVRRFEYEAETLARLDHPGIARVHRLARTRVHGVEVPCLVMEIVPAAKPITKYSGDLALSVPDRVALLAEAAEAIGHGHRHGVLHRDVKPGNILVGPDGHAKVIDYGWARGPDSAAALKSALTAVGQIVGTWQYMAPEQFDPDPAATDLRADVYSLGAVLQELLSGRPPHEYRGGPLYHFASRVRDEPPTPLPHDRTIDRQLRAIVGKCLAKDRNRRYASAVELADDLRRHLAGEPIAPATGGLGDTLVYLARRHAAAAIAAAVSLAALVAATVGIAIFSLRTDRALRAEAESAARLRDESVRANAAAALAEAETENARHQLYVANLHRLALPDAGPVSAVWRLFRQTAALVSPEPFPERGRDLPLELLCLRPRVVQPIARFVDDVPTDVASLATNTAGDRFAIGAGDSVTLRKADGDVVATHRLDSPAERVLFAGRWLAVASRGGTLSFVDATTGSAGPSLALGAGISDLSIDAGGTTLAIGCDDGALRLVALVPDGPTGEPVVVAADRGKIVSIAASRDGRSIATLSVDGTCRLFERSPDGPPRESKAFEGVPDRGGCLALDPSGGWLASTAPGGAIRLVDVAARTTRAILRGHSDRITALAPSPDGRLLASASQDGTTILHDVASAKPVATLSGHRGGLTAIAFRPDGRTIATASIDRTIRLWRVPDGAAERVLEGHDDRVALLAWAADGDTLLSASSDGVSLRWDTTGPDGARAWIGHRRPVEGILFLGTSRRFVSWSGDGSARLWDAATATPILRFPPRREPIRAAAASPDGGTVAFGGADDAIVLHDTHDGGRRQVLRGHGKRVTSIDYSPDGALLASASDDGTARLWNIADGTCVRELEGHAGPVLAVRFAPDGLHLATVSRDRTARVWGVAGEGPPVVLSGHADLVRTVAFSPDGEIVATGSDDGSARLWRARDGEALGSLRAGTSAVTRVAFIAGGTRLVTGTMRGGLDLWDVASGRSVATLDGHTSEIRAIAVTPDGTRIATASSDRTARLWDAGSGVELALLAGHDGPVLALAISADGRDLVTGAADRTIRLRSRTDAEIHEARKAAGLVATGGGGLAEAPPGDR